MGKIISYVLIVLGLAVLFLGVKPVNDELVKSAPFFVQIDSNYFMIGGVVLIVAGVIVLRAFSSGGKQPKEVPIYHGKNVVGFRRIGKK